jgi:hypothetical protein
MIEKSEPQGWEAVLWHPPRLVDGRIVDDECVLHFMYRMPMVPSHKKRTLVKADEKSVYLDDIMLGHRDRLLQEYGFYIQSYVELGRTFMYNWKTPKEKFEAGIRLFEMFTPIYRRLHKLGCSNTQLFG